MRDAVKMNVKSYIRIVRRLNFGKPAETDLKGRVN